VFTAILAWIFNSFPVIWQQLTNEQNLVLLALADR